MNERNITSVDFVKIYQENEIGESANFGYIYLLMIKVFLAYKEVKASA